MYRTSMGVRTLTGAEATLFREGLARIVAMVDDGADDAPAGVGVAVFDALGRGQKLAMLNAVARALLLADEPAPELTAVVEGTVAAVFQYVADATRAEIQLDAPPFWRKLVLAACGQQGFEEVPDPDCADMDEWELQMTFLEDMIFFDADWEGIDEYLDGDVPASRGLKAMMGIDDDYFVDAPLEPTDEELVGMLASLRSLLA